MRNIYQVVRGRVRVEKGGSVVAVLPVHTMFGEVLSLTSLCFYLSYTYTKYNFLIFNICDSFFHALITYNKLVACHHIIIGALIMVQTVSFNLFEYAVVRAYICMHVCVCVYVRFHLLTMNQPALTLWQQKLML